jgi:hypothetical protein
MRGCTEARTSTRRSTWRARCSSYRRGDVTLRTAADPSRCSVAATLMLGRHVLRGHWFNSCRLDSRCVVGREIRLRHSIEELVSRWASFPRRSWTPTLGRWAPTTPQGLPGRQGEAPAPSTCAHAAAGNEQPNQAQETPSSQAAVGLRGNRYRRPEPQFLDGMSQRRVVFQAAGLKTAEIA